MFHLFISQDEKYYVRLETRDSSVVVFQQSHLLTDRSTFIGYVR